MASHPVMTVARFRILWVLADGKWWTYRQLAAATKLDYQVVYNEVRRLEVQDRLEVDRRAQTHRIVLLWDRWFACELGSDLEPDFARLDRADA